MAYKAGEELVSKMLKVFGVTEDNSKEMVGKKWVIKVIEIVNAEKKQARISVLDSKEFAPDDIIMTFLPTVIMNFVSKNQDTIVNGEPIVVEYTGLQPFKDGKAHFGRKTFHGWKFYEAIAGK
jgi:hypothetical protein